MRLRHTHELSAEFRGQLVGFLSEAFAGDFDADDFDHALGGVHVLAVDASGGLLGHAAVVQRRVVLGDPTPHSRVLRAGYVEAVAVAARARRRGIGDSLMRSVDRIVDRSFDVGALAASEAGKPLYLRHDWSFWTGPLGVLSPTGPRLTPDEDGSVLVRVPSTTSPIELSAPLYCDWRPGAVW
ncbi:GNAT family N-acetyltransferase [Gordonia phthalatica]|uniref:GNAT family N-acetyltransferase n=1 Tax=Gordonia phthalatica TaxID=1136941 RepID=UPI0007845769|nr:GNAT family N-acetyltransferase [Gordonia phthalatica]